MGGGMGSMSLKLPLANDGARSEPARLGIRNGVDGDLRTVKGTVSGPCLDLKSMTLSFDVL